MNIDLYDKLFSKAIKQRGEDLFYSGSVEFIEQDRCNHHFEVNGNIEACYDVVINVEDNKIKEMNCNCLYDGFCKHQYACLLELYKMNSAECKVNYTNKIRSLTQNELVADLLYFYNKYDFVNEYYQMKFNTKYSLRDLLNKFDEILKDYYDAIDELDYLDYDEIIDDNRFKQTYDYGDCYFDVNENYFFKNLVSIFDDIVIIFNINYNENEFITLMKYLISLNDDAISIIQSPISDLFVIIDEKINSKILETILIEFKDFYFYKLFLRFYKYINKENCKIFYNVFMSSLCKSEKFLNKYESFLLQYYENEIYNFYAKYVTKNNYHKKYIEYLLTNGKVEEVEIIANEFNCINDKQYVYERLFQHCTKNNLDSEKYALLCLNDNNIQNIYDNISNKSKLLCVIKERLNNKISNSLNEEYVFAFYCNNNFIVESLELVKVRNHLLKNNFHQIYTFDSDIALGIFKCYLDEYIKVCNSNSQYKTIRSWFEKCYFKNRHDFFVDYTLNIIKNTKKRNLKAELNAFLSEINYVKSSFVNYSLF